MDERPWVIKVDSLSKYYGKVCAIRDMSFEVPQGSVTGFVGPNGAGKSTTMRCIPGLTKPSKGSASVFGTDYSKLQNPARRIGQFWMHQSNIQVEPGVVYCSQRQMFSA